MKLILGRLALSSILTIAGILHLVRPEVFHPAIFWGFEDLSNIGAGGLELLLALLLWIRPSLGARLSALWFVVLIPIHVYVSVKGISMFGIDSKLILWIRTILQLPLIWGAWQLKN